MICSNCGNSIEENAVFCAKCGKRVASDELNESTVTENVEAEVLNEENSGTPETPAEEVNPVETTDTETGNATENGTVPEVVSEDEGSNPENSKKKKWKVASAVAGIVAVIAAVGVFASSYVSNFFWKTVMPEEDYFKHVVENNVSDFADRVCKQYSDDLRMYLNDEAVRGDLSIDIGDKTVELVKQYGGGFDIDWLDNVTVSMDSGYKDSKSYAAFDVKLNNYDIGGLDIIADDDGVSIGTPGLSEQGIKAPYQEDSVVAVSVMYDLYKIAPDEKVLEELVVRYVMNFVDAVEDVEEEHELVMAGEVEKKYLKLTAEIDEDVMEEGLRNILVEAKTDKDIKKLISDFCAMDSVGKDFDSVYSDYQDGIDDLLEELDMSYSSVDFKASVWVDNKGDIVGMGVAASDFEISFVNVFKGKTLGTAFKIIVANEFNAIFEGSGKVKSDKFNGDYKLAVMGNDVLSVQLSNFDCSLMKKDIMNGQVVVALSDAAKEMLEGEEILSNGKIVLDMQSTEKYKGKGEFAVYTGDDMLVSLKYNSEKTAAALPVIEDFIDANDYDDMEAWGTKVLRNLQLNLYNAGVPYGLIY